MTITGQPTRGEVWNVCFDPSIGAEMKKMRPAVVISSPSIGKLPLRLVVPITDWDVRYAHYPWFVQIPVTVANGLDKESGADAFQIKSVSLNRFKSRRGVLLDSQLDDIASAVAICVGS
jgi:mRNA interferase MazF